MTDAHDHPVPVACTLDPKQRAARRIEWADLGSLARSTEPVPGGVASTFDLSLADGIEDLADRELSCCGSWLTITSSRSADTIRLELTAANPEGQAVIEAMVDR